MLKIAICDDERYFRKNVEAILKNYAEKNGLLYEIDQFESGKEFLQQGIEMVKYKIVFLDINMDELDGIQTAKKIRQVSRETFIVFVTAYVNYTLEGYKVDAVRYLLKNNVNFTESVEECMDAIQEKMNYSIVRKEFRFQEGVKKFPLNRLLYIESQLHKLVFYIMEDELKTYTLYDTLNSIEGKLEGNNFVRIHQSFLVNMQYIKGVTRYQVLLSNGTKLVIPKARYKYVEEMFVAYKGEV